MAHNLDFSKGSAAFVSKRQPAWHNLGTILPRNLRREDLLTFGGLDFEVIKATNVHTLPTGPVVSKDSFFTYRNDTNRVLASHVGTQYTPVQNHELIDVLEEFDVEYETAGAINFGGRVFVSAKPTRLAIGNDDAIDFYVLFYNGHDGSLSLGGMFTNIRVVCNNTLSAAVSGAKSKMQSKFTLRHTSGIKGRMVNAAEVMGLYRKNAEQMVEVYAALQKSRLTKTQMMDYFGNIFIDADDRAKLKRGGRATDILSTRKQNQLGDLMDFAFGGVGQKEAGEGSAWWAYNAVTGYLTNVKKYTDESDRFDNLLMSNGSKTIDRALELAMSPTLIEPLRATSFEGLSLN